MKYLPFLFAALLGMSDVFAQSKKETVYAIDDSIKAAAVYAEPVLMNRTNGKTLRARLNAANTTITLQAGKNEQSFVMQIPADAREVILPPETVRKNKVIVWRNNQLQKGNLFLLLMTAYDSASNETLYSAYAGWPQTKEWKLLGSYFSNGRTTISHFTTTQKSSKKYSIHFTNPWVLRGNNSWKALNGQSSPAPFFRYYSNIDSIAVQQSEEALLRSRLNKDSVQYKDGIFYQLLTEGKGNAIQVTDTVTVHYRGSLFSDGSVFDETKDKPATFPLNRLIRGWQLALPQCKVGGRIRIWIPSGIAYGIRTFATAIPPNSILVFDVEVLEAKPVSR